MSFRLPLHFIVAWLIATYYSAKQHQAIPESITGLIFADVKKKHWMMEEVVKEKYQLCTLQ